MKLIISLCIVLTIANGLMLLKYFQLKDRNEQFLLQLEEKKEEKQKEYNKDLIICQAAKKTQIRPEFLKAILRVESGPDFKNIGRSGIWQEQMHPDHREAFIQICFDLGLNPEEMPVSPKPSYGWGGAMGPGQIMPKTWLYHQERVAQMSQKKEANPWNFEDSILATALILAQEGASQRNKQAEHKAAMRYFAGSRWNNPKLQWYGQKVMAKATSFEAETSEES